MIILRGMKKSNPLKRASVFAKPPRPRPEAEIVGAWEGGSDEPLVSIQCITYNHAPYIEDALNGFLMQRTTFPFEIWVHDDASTDGTREILEHYKAAYPRIIKTILQSKNQYSQGVRAKFFLRGKCKGKYYALCEGDDFWISSEKLENQVRALEEYPEAHISFHPAYMWDVKKNRCKKMYYKGSKSEIFNVSDAAESLSQLAPTASYLFKADQLESMPDWFFEAKDLPFGDYFRETILGRHGLVYLPYFYCVYRRNIPGSYTVRTNEMTTDDLISRMKSVLYYTNKLLDIKEIPRSSIEVRRRHVYIDYLVMALKINSFDMYVKVIRLAECNTEKLPWYFSIARYNYSIFYVYRLIYQILSRWSFS